MRFGDGFLITPSSLPYDTMQPEDLVEMGWDGTYVGAFVGYGKGMAYQPDDEVIPGQPHAMRYYWVQDFGRQ